MLLEGPQKALGRPPIVIELPQVGEDIVLGYAFTAVTVEEIRAVLRGTSTPSVTFTIRFASDRSAAGTEVVTSGSVVTSTTTGLSVTSFNNATIPAGSWIWLETTAVSGTVQALEVVLRIAGIR